MTTRESFCTVAIFDLGDPDLDPRLQTLADRARTCLTCGAPFGDDGRHPSWLVGLRPTTGDVGAAAFACRECTERSDIEGAIHDEIFVRGGRL
jgi:hypothetical protein